MLRLMKVIYHSNMLSYALLIHLGHRFDLGVWFLIFAWFGLFKEFVVGRKRVHIVKIDLGDEDE